MKRIIFLFLISLIAVFALIHNGQSQTKSYYSGEAINFNNSLYVGSTNTGSLEIFKLENHNLKRLVNIRPTDNRFGRYGNFYDLKFSIESGHLFIYTISNFSLYKYELLSNNQLALINSSKNTYWEWYNRVDKFGNNIITISSKGVKVWNRNLQIITAYTLTKFKVLGKKVSPSSNYNIRAYNNRYILNIQNNYLTVFSRAEGQQISRIPINYKINSGNRQAYQDANNNLFIVDDYYAKKFNLDGKLLGSFRHLDYAGYDVAASGHNKYIYFSNGVGIVKLNKNTMKLAGYRWTTGLGGSRGWSMGLKVVYLKGDKVIVFNNSNILILDQNLHKLADFQSKEKAAPSSVENLYLNLNHSFGSPQANITLNGGGYFPNENLTISFGNFKIVGKTDAHGRFIQKLVVPNLPLGLTDIKVVGNLSHLSYSISFKIQ